MPRAKKQRPPKDPRVCAEPSCGAEFVPNSGLQKYCDDHKNRHTKQQLDRRALGAQARPGYYRPKICVEPGCGTEFEPTSGMQRYCHFHRARAWERRNPEEARRSAQRGSRRSRHLKEFGDPDIYDRLVERDGELCGICGLSIKEDGMLLAVDRCHATDQIRGLLCPSCNTGLGYFKDSPAALRNAAVYVERGGVTLDALHAITSEPLRYVKQPRYDVAKPKPPRPPAPPRDRLVGLEQAEVIAARYLAGESADGLADDYDVHPSTIQRVLRQAGVDLRHGPRGQLSDDQVREIRRLHAAQDRTHVQLAADYGVSRSMVQLITSGKRYTHVV